MSSIAALPDAAQAPQPFVALATAVCKPGQTVPSPCVNVCRMSPTSGLCEGCWRTIDEIRVWSKSDDAGKLAIWTEVEARQRAAGRIPSVEAESTSGTQ